MESGRKQGTASPCAACKLLRRRCTQDCVFTPYFPGDEPQKFASVHKVFGASNVNKMLQGIEAGIRTRKRVRRLIQLFVKKSNCLFFFDGIDKHKHIWSKICNFSMVRSIKKQLASAIGSSFPLAVKELPEYQRSDAVSSMVYEANARMRDPVYGCVGTISSLQQQVDLLQTQLAISQAELVHMKMQQFSSMSGGGSTTNSPENASPSSRHTQSPMTRSLFTMDVQVVDQANIGMPLWSC